MEKPNTNINFNRQRGGRRGRGKGRESTVSPRSQQQRNNGRETVIDLSPPSESTFIDFSVGREVSTSPHNQQLKQNPKNESKGAAASPIQQNAIPKREEPTSPQRQNQQGKGNKSKK